MENTKQTVKDGIEVEDGAYENAATGLGKKGMDKGANTVVVPYTPADLVSLATMKVKDGIAAFIVDGFPTAALMNEPKIIGDEDGDVYREASKIGLFKAVKKAGSYMRLAGGAVVVTEYDSDRKAEELASAPPKSAKVNGYRVYSAGKIDLKKEDFNNGEEPGVFRVKRIGGGTVDVHPSRCTVFKGSELPDIIENSTREQYFGVSDLCLVEQDLRDLASISGAVVNMIQETGTLLLRLNNLSLLLSKPDNGIEDIHKIISAMKLCMNSMRATFAGPKDSYDMINHNFAGIAELWTKKQMDVSAKSRIPMSILFGQSATGLAQTNEGDLKSWCSSVGSWRQEYLYVPTCRLISDFCSRKFSKDFSEFSWGAIDEMTLKQTLEALDLQSQTLERYMNKGVLGPDEVRTSVFENGHSWEVSVKDGRKLPKPSDYDKGE